MADRKWGSTQVVKCQECEFDNRERYVVVVAYEDGVLEVRCNGSCSACQYQPPALKRKGLISEGKEGNEGYK